MSSRATTVPLLVLLGQGAKPYLRDFPDSLLHLEPSLREGQAEAHLHHVPQGGLTLLGLHGKGKKSSSPGSRMCLCGGLHGKGKRLHPGSHMFLCCFPDLTDCKTLAEKDGQDSSSARSQETWPSLPFPALWRERELQQKQKQRANHD